MGTVRRGGCGWNGKGDKERSILPQWGKVAEEPSFVDSIGNRIGLRERLRVTLEATKNGGPAGTCTLLNRLKAGYFAV